MKWNFFKLKFETGSINLAPIEMESRVSSLRWYCSIEFRGLLRWRSQGCVVAAWNGKRERITIEAVNYRSKKT